MTPSPAPPRLGRKPGHSAATMAAAVEASRREKLLAVATRFGVPLSTLRRWRARAGLRRVEHFRDGKG